MKRMRFLSGRGNGTAIVPGGQILAIGMVPGVAGSYCQIDEATPIFTPGDIVLDLQGAELGLCCGDRECDRWPGEVQVQIIFGQNVSGSDEGDQPVSWLVIYNGC